MYAYLDTPHTPHITIANALNTQNQTENAWWPSTETHEYASVERERLIPQMNLTTHTRGEIEMSTGKHVDRKTYPTAPGTSWR